MTHVEHVADFHLANFRCGQVQHGMRVYSLPSEQWWAEIRDGSDPVPILEDAGIHGEFVVTAVAFLPQEHGGSTALRNFFALTETTDDFAEAFEETFGLMEGEFQDAYERQVAERRGSAN